MLLRGTATASRAAPLLAVLVSSFATARPVAAQDSRTKPRLDEIERRLAEQRAEIEALKTQRMQEELRRAPDAPPHVERLPDRSDPASGDTTLDWAYEDGFQVKGTINGTGYLFRPRSFVQLDYRAFENSRRNAAFPSKGTAENRFLLRRAVFGFRGNFGSFDFLFECDPTRLQSNLIPFNNAWLEFHPADELRVRFGHLIPPFTFADGLVAPPFFESLEHPMIVQTLSHNFRPGAMAFGDFQKGALSWFLAANNELDSNDVITSDPIVTARLGTRVGGFALGAAGSWIRLGGPNHNSVTAQTPGQFRFFQPVPVRGWSQRYEVDAILDAGPFWATAEYAWGYQQRNRAHADGSDGAPLIAQGAYLTVGWMFVGPPAGVKGPHVPFKDWNFSLELARNRMGRKVGAELLVRGEWISIDQARGERDFKGNSAKALTFGVNVYLMENVRVSMAYVHVYVGDQSRAERAHSRHGDELLMRAQLEF